MWKVFSITIGRNYAETVPFTKFPHQEIRRNYGIFRSAFIDLYFLKLSEIFNPIYKQIKFVVVL